MKLLPLLLASIIAVCHGQRKGCFDIDPDTEQSKYCDEYKRLGYCTSTDKEKQNKAKTHCFATCGYCKDFKGNCNVPWKKDFLHKHCPLTCGLCKGGCSDHDQETELAQYCDYYKQAGYCTSQDKKKMEIAHKNCIATCGICKKYKSLCNHRTTKELLVKYCPVTCGICKAEEACSDHDSKKYEFICEPFRLINGCKIPGLKTWMKKYCPATCGHCDILKINEGCDTPYMKQHCQYTCGHCKV